MITKASVASFDGLFRSSEYSIHIAGIRTRRHSGQLSNTPGVLGYVMPLLHWTMPSKYHSIHKNDLARAMVAQSEQAFLAIAQGNAPMEATVKILEYKEMEPFFVKGESDEP